MARRTRLSGRRALVTGASSGIGAHAARLLAAEGAAVAVLARDRSALERVAGAVHASGGRAHVLPVDVTDRPALADAVERARERMDGLDLVVVNAAAASFGRFEETAAEDFDRAVEIAFTGAADTIRLVLPELRRSRGTLIVTGSIVASVPAPLFSSYVAAKSALRGLVRTLRVELRDGDGHVSVSLVQPGVVATPFWSAVTSASGRVPRRPPLGYRPEPVARAIVDCAVRPRAEVTVGGLAWAQVAAYAVARPFRDVLLSLLERWLASGDTPATPPGSLWRPPPGPRGEGEGRASLLEAVRRPLRRGR